MPEPIIKRVEGLHLTEAGLNYYLAEAKRLRDLALADMQPLQEARLSPAQRAEGRRVSEGGPDVAAVFSRAMEELTSGG